MKLRGEDKERLKKILEEYGVDKEVVNNFESINTPMYDKMKKIAMDRDANKRKDAENVEQGIIVIIYGQKMHSVL